jgi:hypothetical protein
MCPHTHYYICVLIFTTICVLILTTICVSSYSSSYSICVYKSSKRVLILLHVCPHPTIYVSSYSVLYMCPHTPHPTLYVSTNNQSVSSYYYMCVLILLILLCMCPHTAIYMSSYYLHLCPHTTIFVSSYYHIRVFHTTMHAARTSLRYAYVSIRQVCIRQPIHTTMHAARTSLYMCPHTTTYVSSYDYICVLIPLCMQHARA